MAGGRPAPPPFTGWVQKNGGGAARGRPPTTCSVGLNKVVDGRPEPGHHESGVPQHTLRLQDGPYPAPGNSPPIAVRGSTWRSWVHSSGPEVMNIDPSRNQWCGDRWA